MIPLVRRALAVLLVGTAAAVAVNLAITPLYHDGSSTYPVWEVINWFMAPSAIVVLAVSYLRRRATSGRDVGVVDYLRVTLSYYGAIALAMLFFWGWFWTLNPDSETGEAVTSHLVYFPLVDALFVVLALAVGRRLWNEAGG